MKKLNCKIRKTKNYISKKEKKRLKECDDFSELYFNNLFCSWDELREKAGVNEKTS